MATTPAASGSVLPSGPGRWAIVLGLLFMVGVALVLLFLFPQIALWLPKAIGW